MDKSILQKLELLTKLQNIDSELDSIEKLKGELPEELEELEDSLIGYETRLTRINDEISNTKEDLSELKNTSANAEKLARKYTEQQKNIKNNREFDAITKEIDLQNLEVKLIDKKIKEKNDKIKFLQDDITETNVLIEKQHEAINAKKSELNDIIKENSEQEKELQNKRVALVAQLDENLLNSYNRLRENLRNKLAVVMVRRRACGGCFNVVTPQRQVDIRAQNKIIVCEHCGRIFADVEEIEETT